MSRRDEKARVEGGDGVVARRLVAAQQQPLEEAEVDQHHVHDVDAQVRHEGPRLEVGLRRDRLARGERRV